MKTTAILGASDKPDRYAHMVLVELLKRGHEVILINPRLKQIEGKSCLSSISEITQQVDTLTLYVNPQILEPSLEAILQLKPKRVIFNPGTESAQAEQALKAANITTLRACTLVLLKTNQY